MSRKVLGWNINQRCGLGRAIPEFVVQELLSQNADIIVLTEVVKNDCFPLFVRKMNEAGYEAASTGNETVNEVCILWRREHYRLLSTDDTLISTKENGNPNYLMVALKDETGEEFNVVGYRICIGDKETREEYESRARQMKIVTEKLSELTGPTIVVTDSNNLRRGTKTKEWNLSVLDSMLAEVGYKRNTPRGSSIFSADPASEEYEFAEDHIITNGVVITDIRYDRDFVRRDPQVYKWGEDFTKRIDGTLYYKKIKVGYPDHAILKGYFEIA